MGGHQRARGRQSTTCSRCSPTRAASRTWGTSRSTRSATPWPTTGAAPGTRAAPDGLRRVRASGREPRHQDRRAPAHLHRPVHRRVPDGVPALGHLDRLVARVRHPRAALLPLDPVDLPQAVRARACLPQGGGGQLVPQRRDRARQRAGDRRALRALRHAGRGAPARAVVLPHHRLRRPAARGPGDDRVAAARQDDAAQLDRALGGRRGRVPLRGAGDRLPGVHDAAGHAVRGDVLRHGAGASRRVPAGGGDRARGGGPPLRQPCAERDRRRAQRHRPPEDRRAARPHGHQPGQRRGDPDVRLRLRAHGVRDGGADGGPGARRTRLRLRAGLRAGDPPGHRPGRRGRRPAAHGRRRAGQLR